MATAIAVLRTWAFKIAFVTLSVPVVSAALVSAAISKRAMIAHARFWAGMSLWLARHIAGIRIRFVGELPAGPVLFAIKHQSMLETLAVPTRFGAPAIVLKRELADIPIWGRLAQAYGCIVADRAASAKALRTIMAHARAAAAAGRSTAIFPEGTRVAPGEQPPLKSGFAGLYKILGLPVVPVAVDSGRLWPKTGPLRAGTMTFLVGETIPPGLPRAEIEARVHRAINALEPH